MERVNCNLCGCDDTALWGTKNSINIVKCGKCGLVYCNPRPSEQELQKFYNEDYFNDGNYEYDEKRQRMYEIEIGEIRRVAGAGGSFLDIGCAAGKFLCTLPGTFEKWGTEFSEAASRIGREKFGLNIKTGQTRNIDLPENYFDIVQMRGVLEHSQNPFEDMIKVRRVLKEDGIFRISQLPNIESICAKLFNVRFNQVKPGEHLYYFSVKTVTAMLNKAGFEIISLNYPYLGTPYALFFNDLARVATFFLNQNESPAFFGNMMVIYACAKRSL